MLLFVETTTDFWRLDQSTVALKIITRKKTDLLIVIRELLDFIFSNSANQFRHTGYLVEHTGTFVPSGCLLKL